VVEINFCRILIQLSIHDIIGAPMETDKTLQKLADQTFILHLNIPQNQVAKEHQQLLISIQKTYKSKGFRQGKVPLNIIKQNIPATEIIQELISRLVPPLYSQKIKQYNLKPIIQPQIKFKNPPVKIDKEWQIEITGCQLPQIALKNSYVSQIQKINLTKDKNQLSQILDTLIKNSQVKLPAILIQADLQKQLSSLINQTQQAGLTVDQYFQSQKTNLEEYKKHLSVQIKRQWTINLALDQIAQKEKIEVKPEDIKKATPKDNPSTVNPPALHHFVLQQKVIDFLKSL